MEAAGLALAIVGLAGQAIAGIATLRAFFAAYKSAHAKATSLHFELGSLASTLLEVQQILHQARQDDDVHAKLEQRRHQSSPGATLADWLSGTQDAASPKQEARPEARGEATLTVLEKRMTLCADEVTAWNTASNGLDIGVWSDMRTFARKIKIATSKDLFDEIATRITAHRQAIGNSLSSLTLSAAQENLSLSWDIKGQLDSLASTSVALLKSQQSAESSQQHQQASLGTALATLDTTRRDNHDDQMELMRSMADNISSIASQMSSASWCQNTDQNSPVAAANRGRASPEMGWQSPPWNYIPNETGSIQSDWGVWPADSVWQENGLSGRPSGKPAPKDTWCCGNVLGIDQLFRDGRLCLFCDMNGSARLSNGFFVDSVSFGRHLVESHSFGSCDLDTVYSSVDNFETHVAKFHCKNTYIYNIGWKRLEMFKSNRVFPGGVKARSCETECIREDPDAAKAMIQTQLCHLLQENGSWGLDKEPSDKAFELLTGGLHDNDIENPDMVGIMAALGRLEQSTNTEAMQTLRKAACLAEEASVSELAPILSLRNYEPSLHAAMSQFAMATFSSANEEGDVQDPYLLGYFIPTSTLGFSNCVGCALNSQMRVAYSCLTDFDHHLDTEHGIIDNAIIKETWHKHPEPIPLGVNPRWFSQILPSDSLSSRVDRWMLHCFLVSHNWRILFRMFSSPTQCSAQSWSDWSIEVLRHWESTRVSSLEHPLMDPSEGAVNSRDHTASLASAQRSISRPAAVGAETGAYTCTFKNCTLRFRSWLSLKVHMHYTHKAKPEPRRDDNNNGGPVPKYRCDRINPSTRKPCKTVFSREHDLRRHENTTHNAVRTKVKCELCTEERTFSRFNALIRHHRVVHPDADLPRQK